MAAFTGHLLELSDFHAFVGDHNAGVKSLPEHKVEIVVRTLTDDLSIKGVKIDLPPGSEILGPQKVYRGVTGENYSSFSIEVPDSVIKSAKDLQIVVRDPKGTIIYRSGRTAPAKLRTSIGEFYIMRDMLARIPDIREDITELHLPDPFSSLEIPTDFGVDFYEDLATSQIEEVVGSLVKTIEKGDFKGIGREEVASTVTKFAMSGNTVAIDIEFYKKASGMIRLNTGGPPQQPVKRFLTLSLQARVLPTGSYDINRYAAADLIDIGVKSTKVLVAVGSAFVDKEKYLPPDTETSLATGLDKAIKPFVDTISNAIAAIPQLPLLSGLAGLLGSGVTVTLTGFDTSPKPNTRAAQLRPIVALGFPKRPLAA